MQAIATSVVVFVFLLPAAQKKPENPGAIELRAVGTVDKISDSQITVNRLKGGEPLTFTFDRNCKFVLDGLTVEKKDIKRGMKVRIEGTEAGMVAHRVLAFDKDPLPR